MCYQAAKYRYCQRNSSECIFARSQQCEVHNGWICIQKCRHLRNHPNVCSILGICTDPVAIVMELIPGGSLSSCLADENFEMTPEKVISFAKDIASGMSHLHAENIIHLDLGAV